MSYQALYRSYRPQQFSEVVGQDFIVKTLDHAIQQQKLSHAYLFAGPRGTGKTSIAKIFAKTINCSGDCKPCGTCTSCLEMKHNSHPDVIEMDAASNNSVDDIRELIEKVSYAPIVSPYKVYIIDEVHMLSNSAFNALLKTLEEPPKHVIFILATTDPQKILPTVLSRVQRYNFTKVHPQSITKRMVQILEQEKVTYDMQALELIAELADGGVRDALSMLDQCLVYCNNHLDQESVYQSFGIATPKKRMILLQAIYQADLKTCLELKEEYIQAGIHTKRLMQDLLRIFKEMYFYQELNDESVLHLCRKEDIQYLSWTKKQLLEMLDITVEQLNQAEYSQSMEEQFELLLLKLCQAQNHSQVDELPAEVIEKVVVELDKQEIIPEEVEDTISPVEEVEKQEEIEPVFPESAIFFEPKTDEDFILGILIVATREEKQKDFEYFKQLPDYKYNSDYRNVYLLLEEAQILASSQDAIVVESIEKDNINEQYNNVAIYHFLSEVLGLDKMLYAIHPNEKQQLFEQFKQKRNTIKQTEIVRYVKEKEKTIEDKLQDLFGPVVDIKE